MFTLIDWAVERVTGEPHNDYTPIITLPSSGFLLRSSHHRGDEIVTNALFKPCVADAKELHEVAGTLACTASTATFHVLLLSEPLRVLRLPASALFLSDDAGDLFAPRVATRGRVRGECRSIVDQEETGFWGPLAARRGRMTSHQSKKILQKSEGG